MPITSARQASIIKLTVGMFNAAPGGYMNILVDAFIANGSSLENLANTLANSSAFQGLSFAYSSSATNQEFATAFINNLVGDYAAQVDKAAAVSYISGLLTVGQSRGSVMNYIIDVLDGIPFTDVNWGAASNLFNNRVAVATAYTIDQGGSSTSLAALHNTIASVDTTAASVTAAIAANSSASGQTFTLTTSVDMLTGTSGDDTFIASQAYHNATLAGGAGSDTFEFVGTDLGSMLKTSGGTRAVVNITDFVAGTDKIGLMVSGSPFALMALDSPQSIRAANNLTDVYSLITAIAPSIASRAASGVVVTVAAGAAAGTYLYVNDGTAAVDSLNDMLINITGITGTLANTDFVFA